MNGQGDFMNIQQLKYFIEIANTKNLSAAARNLFVTQPTLSLALKKMESELRTSLFSHTDTPFQLTNTGVYLYEEGYQIVEQFDQLISDIHNMNENPTEKKKKIKLGITTLFSVQFMQEISQYLATHPHVDLVIKQDGSPHLQGLLNQDELDIGLISFPNIYPETISIEALGTSTKGYHVYVVVPEDNPLSQKKNSLSKILKVNVFHHLQQTLCLEDYSLIEQQTVVTNQILFSTMMIYKYYFIASIKMSLFVFYQLNIKMLVKVITLNGFL